MAGTPVAPFLLQTMTLDEMASAIRNNVGNGLKEVGNYTYSLDQLKDEIRNARSRLIKEEATKGILNPAGYTQKKDNIPVTRTQYPESGPEEMGQPALKMSIPNLAMTAGNSSIMYLGPADMSLNLRIYYDYTRAKMHQYTRVLKNRPYALIDQAQDGTGSAAAYIFNAGPVPFKYAAIRAIFDDPSSVSTFGDAKDFGSLEDADTVNDMFNTDEEFPAPGAVQDMIIEALSKKYILYYKRHQPNEPNDQTDKL